MGPGLFVLYRFDSKDYLLVMNFIFNQQKNISAALSIFHILNNPLSIFPERWFLTATVISKKIINTQGNYQGHLKIVD